MKIVCMFTGRPENVVRTETIFGKILWVISDKDKDSYLKYLNINWMLIHPDEINGIGLTRQWILDNVDDDIIVMVDDDIYFCACLMGLCSRRIENHNEVCKIIGNAGNMAYDMGVHLFGFNQGGNDVRKYNPFKPFSLNSWVGTVVGVVIGGKAKFDPSLLLRCDIDYSLQNLMHDRIVFVDNRYSFGNRKLVNKGGGDKNRSSDRHKKEIDYLKMKWGKYINEQQKKQTIRLIINVER